ncbi:hypothetical protein ECHLIB_0902 [Ehrlichia chaffeensis str. Liberty]|nr:hypothetical protein ECHJAX_0899 [Ehrlichia chaffeensis str. Jax]AHX06940.1 hypothetical protein ECHLIB_0902 [Ehrlichia chaffeensis str. Liberty]AHX08249.1 hypothetical protein ECHSTV_0888 [Ehrlichia chaffeensis str. Saint Vincent]
MPSRIGNANLAFSLINSLVSLLYCNLSFVNGQTSISSILWSNIFDNKVKLVD